MPRKAAVPKSAGSTLAQIQAASRRDRGELGSFSDRMPLVQGRLMDVAGTAEAFIVPAVCLAFVTAYALFDLRTNRDGGELVAEGAH